MTWERSILVLTNLPAASAELGEQLAANLKAYAARGAATFTLIASTMPFGDGREDTLSELSHASSRLRDAGLTADVVLGDSDPLIAVSEVWDPSRYDEIIISTLPTGASKWLHAAFPERVAKLTGAPVTHLVCEPWPPAVETEAAPASDHGSMGPLTVLGWGGPRRSRSRARLPAAPDRQSPDEGNR
jgi:hypothetical protein